MRLGPVIATVLTLAAGPAAAAPLPRVCPLGLTEAPAPEALDAVRVEARVGAVLASMSLEQKVGQLLFVGFGGRDVTPGGPIERLVRGKQVGGVALFSRNIASIPQAARFTRQLSALMPDLPPFVAVDQEGGNVARLGAPATVLPGNMALGAAHDLELTRRAAARQAHDLWLLGFNMNLAPVLDVNSNPRNPVIGIRSFGEDAGLVSAHGSAYVAGLQAEGVAAVAKHFPGHGDTVDDSHFALPSLPHDERRLLSVELAPFQAAAAAGLDAVMTAHIALPEVEGRPGVPATVSRRVLTGLLRERMGFDGLVITDGLEMRGIVETIGSGRAAVEAILAGADMVLILWTPALKEEVHRALLRAARDGTLSEARLDASVRRILRVKVRRGLFDRRPPPVAEAMAGLASNGGESVAHEIAGRALTLVRPAPGLTPLDGRHRRVGVVSADATFAREMRRVLPSAQVVRTPAVPTRADRARGLEEALALARRVDVLVVGVLNRYQSLMVQELLRTVRTPVVVVALGSPYLLADFPDVHAYVVAYSYRDSAARAAARFLGGRAPAPGRLPVTLPGLYPAGHGAADGTRTAAAGVPAGAAPPAREARSRSRIPEAAARSGR